jgi:protein SCO1/2
MTRQVLASLLVSVLGLAGLAAATDGFRAFTSEQARRLAVLAAPKAPPPIWLQDQDGQRVMLSDFRGKVVLVDFLYTRCASICRIAGAQVAAVTQRLVDEGFGDQVVTVAISFDPQRDTPAVLRAHAARIGADPARWRFARPADAADQASLLNSFGVVALPDGKGEFQHNGAVHLLARDGRLVGIYDYEMHDAIVRAVRHQS